MPFERLLDDAALHAGAAAMNQPHLPQPGGVCLGEVLFNDRRDVARREGVQIEGAFDRNAERFFLSRVERVLILHHYVRGIGLSYLTVTSVLMPPRTEK